MVEWWLAVLLALSWTLLPHCKCTFKEVTADYIREMNTNLDSLNFPVIVKGGFKELTARGSSPEEFVKNVGKARMAFSTNVELQSQTGEKAEMLRMTVEDWIGSLPHEEKGLPKYVFSSLQDVEHQGLDKKLLEMYPVPHYLQPWSLNRFIVMGSKSKGVAMHQHQFSWVGLLAGKKMWLVFPPDARLPEDVPMKHHSRQKLKKIPGVEFCDQEASDLVFIPESWWHATFDAGELTVGLGSQNRVETSATHISWEVSTGNLTALQSRKFNADEKHLQLASQSGHKEVVEFLLRKKAPLGNSMMSASYAGHQQIIETLISHRISATKAHNSDTAQRSPLSWSVLGGRSRCVELLLRHRAEVNEIINGKSQLDMAAEVGHTEVAQVLLKAGADTIGLNDDGFAPIHSAAFLGHGMVVRALLDNGVDPAMKTSNGFDVSEIAVELGHSRVRDALARKGPQIRDLDSEL